ncbi:MAG: type II toxin-antitoxin system prevent-host-death family antitoxin [Gemmatimonadota bacterium]|nr:type II toxin-antitoxin system prevent-host-death family antitoxin [Gemmatimonadota bacterium]
MTVWTLEKAKNQFSEVVRRALGRGPQEVRRGRHDAVVVLSKADYERLIAPQNLAQFLRLSPLARAVAAGEISIERSKDNARDVEI